MLTIHHLGISQSDRIVWLCEELGVPYTLKRYERDATTRLAPADYKALHPAGTAPVITDSDLVLGESGAIMEYILHTYGDGRLTVKPGDPGYADYLFWFHFSNGSLMPIAMMRLVAAAAGQDATSPIMGFIGERDRRAFGHIEARLGAAPYFAGEAFTAADIIMAFPLTTGRLFGARDLSGAPNTRAWLKRIGARPAFQRAMAAAEPGLPIPLD